jgi:hypothetical protein
VVPFGAATLSVSIAPACLVVVVGRGGAKLLKDKVIPLSVATDPRNPFK